MLPTYLVCLITLIWDSGFFNPSHVSVRILLQGHPMHMARYAFFKGMSVYEENATVVTPVSGSMKFCFVVTVMG
jgi:hypothetical protein